MARVVTMKENAGAVINGVRFGSLKRDGGTVRVSQEIEDAGVVDRFLAIGFALFDGPESGEDIDKAIGAEAQTDVGRQVPTDARLGREDELKAANANMAAKLIDVTDERDKLRAEVVALRAKDTTKIEAQLVKANEDAASVRQELAALRDKGGVAPEDFAQLQASLATLQDTNGKLAKENVDIRTDLDAIRAENVKLKKAAMPPKPSSSAKPAADGAAAVA